MADLKEIALDDEIREDNRILTGWLLFYHERKKEYLLRREEILESSPPCLNETLPGRGNCISDPTGRKGDKLAELAETERWLEFVEELERRLPRKMMLILQLRREVRFSTRKRGACWQRHVADRYAEIMSEIFKIKRHKKGRNKFEHSLRTVDEWWRKIIEYAGRLAAKRGLL